MRVKISTCASGTRLWPCRTHTGLMQLPSWVVGAAVLSFVLSAALCCSSAGAHQAGQAGSVVVSSLQRTHSSCNTPCDAPRPASQTHRSEIKSTRTPTHSSSGSGRVAAAPVNIVARCSQGGQRGTGGRGRGAQPRRRPRAAHRRRLVRRRQGRCLGCLHVHHLPVCPHFQPP